jgi:hypothetical protein
MAADYPWQTPAVAAAGTHTRHGINQGAQWSHSSISLFYNITTRSEVERIAPSTSLQPADLPNLADSLLQALRTCNIDVATGVYSALAAGIIDNTYHQRDAYRMSIVMCVYV